MKIEYDINELERFDHFKGGKKYIEAKMSFDGLNRILFAKLPVGATIGEHKHETNSEIVYIVDGQGTFIYDGKEETVKKGDIHYCPKGHKHTLINDSDDTLTIFAVVPEQ